MKLDILDSLGNRIGVITDEYESSAFLVIIGIIAFIFLVVFPIAVWFIFFFKPDFFKYIDKGKEMLSTICSTAIIASIVWGFISRLIFRSRFPLGQFFISWLVCSSITIASVVINYNWRNFGDSILIPLFACELPCFLSMVIYAIFYRNKQA